MTALTFGCGQRLRWASLLLRGEAKAAAAGTDLSDKNGQPIPPQKVKAMPASTYTRPTASILPTSPPHLAPQPPIAPVVPPVHVVDLMTVAGSAAFGARWKGMEAKIVPCPALSDSMPEFKTTYDIEPHAELLGFDDSDWQDIAATDLGARRGGGMVSFYWFRTKLMIPATLGSFDPAGAKAVLTVNVDDYAEIWVDGALPRAAGRPSPAAIQGFNMPNRLVLRDAVKPGEAFEIAVFAINGPISAAPANFLWFREAKVEFYR
jgi:gluconolactonase